MGADWGEAGEWNWMGMRCHWRVLGPADAPAMVLVHGFGASSSHWRHNAHPLMEAEVQSLDEADRQLRRTARRQGRTP